MFRTCASYMKGVRLHNVIFALPARGMPLIGSGVYRYYVVTRRGSFSSKSACYRSFLFKKKNYINLFICAESNSFFLAKKTLSGSPDPCSQHASMFSIRSCGCLLSSLPQQQIPSVIAWPMVSRHTLIALTSCSA